MCLTIPTHITLNGLTYLKHHQVEYPTMTCHSIKEYIILLPLLPCIVVQCISCASSGKLGAALRGMTVSLESQPTELMIDFATWYILSW
jgi:hypothetical protein